jgi:predicted nucleic acid-binding protein
VIVLDTNVASELMKAAPDPAVLDWYERHRPGGLCTTAVTVAEIRYGIALMPDGRRKTLLQAGAGAIFADRVDAVLPFDVTAAEFFPDVVVQRNRAGLPIAPADAMIAAICRGAKATLVTRNTKDFVETGLELINPWE